MPISLLKSKIWRKFVFSKSSFSVKAVKYKLRIVLYALHESLFVCCLTSALFRPLVPRIVEVEHMRHVKNDL